MPLKYLADSPGLVHYLGAAHGYLYLILLFAVADLARRRRFPVRWILAVALAGTVPFLSFVAERAVTARVNRAIASLPERQKLAVTLVYFEGMSNISAASVMEISVDAIESLLTRGKRALRESLAEDWRGLLDELSSKAG